MADICKEYKGLRMSIEDHFEVLSVFVYRNDKLLTNVVINPLDAKRVLEAVLTPLVAQERYEDSVVVRDLIKELSC